MPDVIVTNKNEEEYARRYDGTEYEFPPGAPVTIPEDAARYIFGYGGTDADRSRIVIRNGWQKNGVPGDPLGPREAMKKLRAFVFKVGAEEEAPPKKAKKLAPEHQTKPGVGAVLEDDGTKKPRQPTGIGAMSDLVDEHGNRKAPPGSRETIHMPPKGQPVAPRLPPA